MHSCSSLQHKKAKPTKESNKEKEDSGKGKGKGKGKAKKWPEEEN